MNNITFISPGNPNQRTGGYLYNYEIIKGLKHAGDNVSITILEGNWNHIKYSSKWDSQLTQINKNNMIIIDAMAWFVLKKKTQINLAQSKKLWIIVHHLSEFNYDKNKKNEVDQSIFSLNMASNWIVPSKMLKDIINSRLKNSKGYVIEPGIHKTANNTNKNFLNLLSVAHLIPRKGHDNLLISLAKLQKYNWNLRIAGSLTADKSWVDYLKRLAKELSIENRVTFTGLCDQKELDNHYKWAGLLVHPAYFESYGMVLAEALSRNIPIISTKAGAIQLIRSKAIIKATKNTLKDRIEIWFKNEVLRNTAYRATKHLIFPSWNQQVYMFRSICNLKKHSFSSNWLQIREPFDHKARSKKLVQTLLNHINIHSPTILDIATGLGSGPRFINQLTNKTIFWKLLDYDKMLLNKIKYNPNKYGFSNNIDLLHQDVHDFSKLPTKVDAVTTQALLDLTSNSWLHQFSDWLAMHRLPFLAALSVNGVIKPSIEDSLDQKIFTAFKYHQTWDRGFGPSVGINATKLIKSLLKKKGFKIKTTTSNWIINQNNHIMMNEMLYGIASAAIESIVDIGGHEHEVKEWLIKRLKQVGSLELIIGHTDLLAIPNSI